MQRDVKTFVIGRTFSALSKGTPWVFVALVVFSIALPFLPGYRQSNPIGAVSLSVLGVCFFGVLGWYGFRIAKRLPYCAVSIDKDGLWSAHLSKETALIRWGQVHSTRERVYLQRLDLLDSHGNVLIKLEYQLSGFETLRALLVEKMQRPTAQTAPLAYAKRSIYHAIYIVSIAGFSLLGWYIGMSNPLLGYGGMAILVALIGHEYLKTVSRVTLLRDRLQLGYPFRTREVFRAELEGVEITDVRNQGTSHPEVGLFIRGENKPIRLRGLGVDAVNLHQTLEQWQKDSH